MISNPERVQTVGGHTAVFDTRPDTSDAALVHGIIAGREYDLPTGLSGWAIDIGAHIGIVTVAVALDNPDLRIVAVEALPENVVQLRRNVELNGVGDRVFIEEAAAGEAGESKVGITYGWSRAVNQPDHYMADNRYIGGMVGPNESSRTITCSVVTFADCLNVIQTATRPDRQRGEIARVALLKIDCEGCEWYFLKAPEVWKVDRIIGELHHGKNGGAKEFRALLEPTHDVTMDDSLVVATFEAVRR